MGEGGAYKELLGTGGFGFVRGCKRGTGDSKKLVTKVWCTVLSTTFIAITLD